MMLEDGTYELVLEPEQGISKDQVHIAEDLTEAPNQSLAMIDIPDPSPTQPHPRRQASVHNPVF
jgi:hypothetical protein